MNKHNVYSIPGTHYPAGRNTKVLIGPNAPVEAEGFVMGHVTIEKQGSVPCHHHPQEEVYLIVEGTGEIQIGDKVSKVKKGDYVYIKPHEKHSLKNTGEEEMIMIFCYAPKGVVEHWQQEKQGKLK